MCDRGGNTEGGEEDFAHISSTLTPSSTRDLSLEREPVRGASQPGHKGRIQGPLPTPRRGGGWVPGTDTRSWAVSQSYVGWRRGAACLEMPAEQAPVKRRADGSPVTNVSG